MRWDLNSPINLDFMLPSLLWTIRLKKPKFWSLLIASSFVSVLNAQIGEIQVTLNPDAVEIERSSSSQGLQMAAKVAS